MTRPARRARGATLIEFALVLVLFLTFLLGVTDFARMLWTWNAATEATRAGARYAAVCDGTANQAEVLARMQALLPLIQAIDVAWEPAGCTASTCTGVRVSVVDLQYSWLSPIAGLATALSLPMPGFDTSLTREVMRQDPNSETLCTS